MVLFDSLRTDFTNNVKSYGTSILIQHYTGSVSNTEWDDAQALTGSGTDVWVSGMYFPIKATRGSTDAILLEQGKITQADKSLFLPGDTETTPIMKIGIGSPVTHQHSVIPEGIITHPMEEHAVYKKMYIRTLETGSLIGEY